MSIDMTAVAKAALIEKCDNTIEQYEHDTFKMLEGYLAQFGCKNPDEAVKGFIEILGLTPHQVAQFVCAERLHRIAQEQQYQHDEQERLEQEEQFYINNPHEG